MLRYICIMLRPLARFFIGTDVVSGLHACFTLSRGESA